MTLTFYMASDHAGFSLKKALCEGAFYHFVDRGPMSNTPTDYPDYIQKVVEDVLKDTHARGILICGTGIGMCMGANKFPGIRAVVGHTLGEVQLARAHNDANILCLGARMMRHEKALKLIKAFHTPFDKGRHIKRLEKLDSLKIE